jgi:hypothetical protein
MLYIDTYPAFSKDIEGVYQTTAHEFQHLINFMRTVNVRSVYEKNPDTGQVSIKQFNVQDTWINEGLSVSAEYLYRGSQVTNRIKNFNEDRITSEKLIRNGNNFFVFDSDIADYATDYLFFQWLRIHAKSGMSIYTNIINSPYSNYNAILATANASISNPSGKPWTWPLLLKTWLAANVVDNPLSIYGYGREITNLTVYPPSPSVVNDNQIMLNQGEAVYSKINGTRPTDTDKINYTVVAGGVINNSSESGTLISCNVDTILYSGSSAVKHPASALVGDSFNTSSVRVRSTVGEEYGRIDARRFLDNNGYTFRGLEQVVPRQNGQDKPELMLAGNTGQK